MRPDLRAVLSLFRRLLLPEPGNRRKLYKSVARRGVLRCPSWNHLILFWVSCNDAVDLHHLRNVPVRNRDGVDSHHGLRCNELSDAHSVRHCGQLHRLSQLRQRQ